MLRAGIRRAGFTLIELLVVIAIMAGVIAMASPRLLPVLIHSTHEGAARHLANYGTAAIAQAAFDKEALTFRFDFDTQEYWLERIPEPPEDEEDEAKNTKYGDDTKEKNNLPKDNAELEAMAQKELEREVPQGGKRSEDGVKVLDEQSKRMLDASNKRARRYTGAQAARVKQDEDALPPSQRERSKKVDPAAKKMEPKEIHTDLLGRTRLPEEITLVLASVGGQEFDEKIVEVELTPAGLDVEAKFWLMNAEGDTFVVTWDPATGQTRVDEESSR